MKKLVIGLVVLVTAGQLFGQDLGQIKKQLAQKIDIQAVGAALAAFAQRINWNESTESVAQQVAQQINEQLGYIPDAVFGVITADLQNIIKKGQASANIQTFNTIKDTFQNRLPAIYQGLKIADALLKNPDISVDIVHDILIPFVVDSGKLTFEVNDAFKKLNDLLAKNKGNIVAIATTVQPYIYDLLTKIETIYNQREQLIKEQPMQLATDIAQLFDFAEVSSQAQALYPVLKQQAYALVQARKSELRDIFNKLKNTDLNQLRSQLEEAKNYAEQQISNL